MAKTEPEGVTLMTSNVRNIRFSLNKKKNTLSLFVLCLPAIALIFIFNYIPMAGVLMAFQNTDYTVPYLGGAWAGLKNFEYLVRSNEMFTLIRNTVLYNLAFIISGTVGGVALAILLNEITKRTFVKLYQTVIFFPYFISWVNVTIMLSAFIDDRLGLLNTVLRTIGIEPLYWYGEPEIWPVIVVLANLWKGMGYSCMIYYASIIGIDREQYEAATIDGAGKLQQIRSITLPHLSSLITLFILLGLGSIFTANFDMFLNLSNGVVGGDEYMNVLDVTIFKYLRITGDTGTASAIGFLQSIVGFCVVMAANLIIRKTNSENALF